MLFKKIHIPKNKKKIKKKFFDVQKIINFETKIFDLYNKGKIKYPIHLTKGNENQLVEIFKYVDNKDWVFTSWRNHAHALLHGIPEKKLKKQIMTGKSMYISSKKNNFFCSSIAGGIIPIALGSALALKKKEANRKFGYL